MARKTSVPVPAARYELPSTCLRRTIDPRSIPFATTASLEPPAAADAEEGRRHEASREMLVGQRRAVDALDFGLRVRARGFNIFVLGTRAAGRRPARSEMVERERRRSRPGWT